MPLAARGLCFRYRNHAHDGFVALFFLEHDYAVRFGEQGVVAAHTYVLACVVFGASLAYDDVAGNGCFAGEDFNAQAFALRIASVLGTADSFLVCQFLFPFFWLDRLGCGRFTLRSR